MQNLLWSRWARGGRVGAFDHGGHNMTIKLQHTADDFRDWLRGKDEDEIVGVRGGSTTNCPIARWLSDVWQQRVYVTCVCGIYDQYGRKIVKRRDLPQWLTDYIEVVDNSEPG